MPCPYRCSRPGWMCGPGQSDLVLDLGAGSPACGGGWNLVILEIPSNPNYSVVLSLKVSKKEIVHSKWSFGVVL